MTTDDDVELEQASLDEEPLAAADHRPIRSVPLLDMAAPWRVGTLDHIVYCDLGIVSLKIHSTSPWDTSRVRTREMPDPTVPVVNVFICDEDDEVFDRPPTTYREEVMRRGSYRGHHFGPPAGLRWLGADAIAISHPDPGLIIWTLVVKHVLTVHASRAGLLHLKGAAVANGGGAFLFLGRGGSGKTEVVRALCANGCRLMGNTHLLVDGASARGITTNMRLRSDGGDHYLSVGGQGMDVEEGWLPIGGVFWLRYRTDGQTLVELLPRHVAKANLRFFAEAIQNWEMKEDIADLVGSDPSAFARQVERVDALLDDFCARHDVHDLQTDVFSDDGVEDLMALLGSEVRHG